MNGTIYHEPGMFAGWPANQGIWSWRDWSEEEDLIDEILVGFVEGKTAPADEKDRWRFGHQIDTTKPMKHVFARSKDGGVTWAIEDRDVGRAGWTYDNTNKAKITREFNKFGEPKLNFLGDDFAAAFVRETNHVGPSHFYFSIHRGGWWLGPYEFDVPGFQIASRTDYIVLNEDRMIVMATAVRSNNREGQVICVGTDDGGRNWKPLGPVCNPIEDGFAIMPSSVFVYPYVITAIRRNQPGNRRARTESKNWIEIYSSIDCHEWRMRSTPVLDTGHSGGPGHLVDLGEGRLALFYTVRMKPSAIRNGARSRLCYKISEDNGFTWGEEEVIRADGVTWDLGYAAAVKRSDGKVVVAYYWATEETFPDRTIDCSIVEV